MYANEIFGTPDQVSPPLDLEARSSSLVFYEVKMNKFVNRWSWFSRFRLTRCTTGEIQVEQDVEIKKVLKSE